MTCVDQYVASVDGSVVPVCFQQDKSGRQRFLIREKLSKAMTQQSCLVVVKKRPINLKVGFEPERQSVYA